MRVESVITANLNSANPENILGGLEMLSDIIEAGAIGKAGVKAYAARLAEILAVTDNPEIMDEVVNIFLKIQVHPEVLPVVAKSIEDSFSKLPKGTAEDGLAILAEHTPERIENFISLIEKYPDASTKQAIMEARMASSILMERHRKGDGA